MEELKISEQEIKKALDEAYAKAGMNAYFGNGFHAGVQFVINYIKNKN
jgi:hypothetical protein